MEYLTQYQNFDTYREALRRELTGATESFVRIGYLLKLARDTDILKDSGFESYLDFARVEYGLDKTQVSRFININTKYSEGGNSDHLLPEYQGYGYAKLAVMLTLPDEITEDLSPTLSKSEIETVKKEYDEEQKITDIEVALEEKPVDLSNMSTLEKLVFILFKDDPDLFRSFWEEDRRLNGSSKDIICPTDKKIYVVRIPGEGRYNLTFNENGEHSYLNQRDLTREGFTWGDFYNAFNPTLPIGETPDYMEAYRAIYGIDFPEAFKDEVAPVQQKKESRVTVAKPGTAGKPEKSTHDGQAKITKPADIEADNVSEPENGEKTTADGYMNEPKTAPTACQPAEPVDVWNDKMNEPIEGTYEEIKEPSEGSGTEESNDGSGAIIIEDNHELSNKESDRGRFIREGIAGTLEEIAEILNKKPDIAINAEDVKRMLTKVAEVLNDIGEYKKLHNMEVEE